MYIHYIFIFNYFLNYLHKHNSHTHTTEKNEKLKTPFDLDPLVKIKRLILSSKIYFKKEYEYFIKHSHPNNRLINQKKTNVFIFYLKK